MVKGRGSLELLGVELGAGGGPEFGHELEVTVWRPMRQQPGTSSKCCSGSMRCRRQEAMSVNNAAALSAWVSLG